MEKLSGEAVYEDEQYYWFAEMRCNGFYRVEKATMKAELLFHFPEEALDVDHLFSDMIKAGDWFVFAPFIGENIVLYHEKTKEIKTLSVKELCGDGLIGSTNNTMKFSKVLAVGNQVYFFPKRYPAIVTLDLSNMTLRYDVDWVDGVTGILPKQTAHSSFYFFSTLRVGSQIYAPLACCPAVLLLNCETGKTSLKTLNSDVIGFSGISHENGNFWLTPTVGTTITKWIPDTETLVSYPCSQESPARPMIYNPVIYKDTLYVSCSFSGIPYELNLQTGECKESALLLQVLQAEPDLFSKKYTDLFCLRLVDNELRCISGKNLEWYTVDLETQEVKGEFLWADPVGEDILQNKPIYSIETAYFGVDDFVRLMNRPDPTVKKKEAPSHSVGAAILRATT